MSSCCAFHYTGVGIACIDDSGIDSVSTVGCSVNRAVGRILVVGKAVVMGGLENVECFGKDRAIDGAGGPVGEFACAMLLLRSLRALHGRDIAVEAWKRVGGAAKYDE